MEITPIEDLISSGLFIVYSNIVGMFITTWLLQMIMAVLVFIQLRKSNSNDPHHPERD